MKLPFSWNWPFATSLAFTAAAVVLAIIPGGAYDATLAILTGTLIAVIWYTYFTYRAVEASEVQRREIEAMRRRRNLEFLQLVQSFVQRLEALPDSAPTAGRVVKAQSWELAEVSRLEVLLSEVGPSTTSRTATACNALRSLRDFIDRKKREKESKSGAAFPESEVSEYLSNRATALDYLRIYSDLSKGVFDGGIVAKP